MTMHLSLPGADRNPRPTDWPQSNKQPEFELSLIADGMLAGRKIRSLQANYGISLCGPVFETHSRLENDRKYQKAVKIAERLAILGCSSRDNLPYFNAADHSQS